MKIKKILIIVTAIIIVCASGAAIYYIARDKLIIDSYTACGCGGCGGKPIIQYLYESKDGRKELDDIISSDKSKLLGSTCIYAGCSGCTEYRLVDDKLWY